MRSTHAFPVVLYRSGARSRIDFGNQTAEISQELAASANYKISAKQRLSNGFSRIGALQNRSGRTSDG